nr:hypothetical protein [Tanacetum cinerariifolium]
VRRKKYGETKHLCPRCNFHHDGPCGPKCNNFKRTSHIARDCRSRAANTNNNNNNNYNNRRAIVAYQGVPTCFECGAQGHYKNNCPKLGNKNQGNQNQAGNGNDVARAYAVGTAGGNPDANVMTGADNRPPMLEKDMYDSWKSRMELYMLNRPHGRMILESVEQAAEAIQADCDVKATNIILQGLPPKVYALVSTHKVTKELWECIQMLMHGTSLTKQERECKLYDAFDKFAYQKGETLRTDISPLVNHNAYMSSSSAPRIAYAPMDQQSSEYSPPEAGLVVPVFQKGDDPIDAINHMMSFLTSV